MSIQRTLSGELPNELTSELESAYTETDGDEFIVADLGCGAGHYHRKLEDYLEDLGDRDVKIIGFDSYRKSLENNERNQTALSDLRKNGIPIKDSSIDFVFSNNFKNDIITSWAEEEFESLQKEVNRVLKKRGSSFHGYHSI